MATGALDGLEVTQARGRVVAPRAPTPAILRRQARLLARLKTARGDERIPLLRELLALKEQQLAETAAHTAHVTRPAEDAGAVRWTLTPAGRAALAATREAQ